MGDASMVGEAPCKGVAASEAWALVGSFFGEDGNVGVAGMGDEIAVSAPAGAHEQISNAMNRNTAQNFALVAIFSL